MSLPSFGELHRRADAIGSPVPVAIAGGADRTVLEACRVALDRGWVEPILVGVEPEIRRLADEAGIDLDGFVIRDFGGPEGQAAESVTLVRAGRAKLLAKGQIATPSLMQAIHDPEHGLRTGRVVSQVVLMEIVADGRKFLMADTGVTVRPKLASKVEIVRQVVEVAQKLGEPHPRVAIMAATEAVHSSMPETVDAAELRREGRDGRFPGAIVDGPLSFDLAYSPDAVGKKGVDGEVVGRADAMVFPDLASANLTVKAIMYTADCRFGGVLRGTTVPIAFMSRSDTAATRLNSLALALAVLRNERAPDAL